MEGKKIDLLGLIGSAEGKHCHERKVNRRHDDQDGDHEVEDKQRCVSTRLVLMCKKVHVRPSANRP